MTINDDAVSKLLDDEDGTMDPQQVLRLSLLLRLVKFVSRGVAIMSGDAEHHGGVLVSSHLDATYDTLTTLRDEDVPDILGVEAPTLEAPTLEHRVLAEALVMSWILAWVRQASRDATRPSIMGIHPVGVSIGA